MTKFIKESINKCLKKNKETYYTDEILVFIVKYIFGRPVNFFVTDMNIIESFGKKRKSENILEANFTLTTDTVIENYNPKILELNELFVDCFFIETILIMPKGRNANGEAFYEMTIRFYIKFSFDYNFFKSYTRLMQIK